MFAIISVFKIYEEKTIEVGIYIDRHLYKNMEEVLFMMVMMLVVLLMPMILQVLKTQDEAKVKEQFLKMVHSLFLQVFKKCLT